jgi:hypothetical protein
MLQLLALPLALAGGHASLHPADSNLYFELTDLPAMAQAYEQAPLMQLLSDPEWSTFAARALGEDIESFRLDEWCTGYFESSLTEVAAMAGTDVDLRSACTGLRAASFSLRAPELSGSVEEVLTEPANEAVVTEDYLAQLGAVLILDYADAESAQRGVEFCVSALQLIPEPVQHKQAPLTLLGQEGLAQHYRHTNPGPLPAVWSATCGASAVFGFGTMSPDAWRALADSRNAQLAGNASFAAGSETRTSSESVALYDAFIDVAGMTELVDVVRHYEQLDSLVDLASTLEALLPDDEYTARCRSFLIGDRFEHESVSRGASVVQGLGVAPVERRAVEFLPPEAIGAWATSVNAADFEPLLLELVAAWLESDITEARRFLQEDVGIEAAELLEPLGTAAAAYVMPFAGPTIPEFAVIIELEDRERLQVALDKLFSVVEERHAATLDSRAGKYRGQALYTLLSKSTASSWGLPDLGAANMILDTLRAGVSVALLEDRVLISMDRRFVTREVKRVLKADEDAPVHPLAAADSIFPATATCVSMLDWGGGLGSIYDTVRALAPLAGAGMLPFDPEILPPTTALTRHFRPSVSWSTPGDAGTRTQASSSFGPESTLLVASLVGLFAYESMASDSGSARPVTQPVDPGPDARPGPAGPRPPSEREEGSSNH